MHSSETRRRRLGILAAAGSLVAAGVIAPLAASAGPISSTAGFEGDDANLAVDTDTDWNAFDPVTWTGTAPYQTGASTADGWKFFGLTDDIVSNADTAFSGGVKQDNFCAGTKGGKAPNKDDLVRTYLSSKTVGGDVFLNLAWARIPQNSTTASAHVAFEFNQGETACPDGSPLVEREPGDALIVYDFEGGDAAPTLKLSRWLETEPAGWVGDWEWDDYTCEISGDPPVGEDYDGCWGNTLDLTASGYAEAAVNTDASVSDELGPDGTETLGLVEFGEAIINLTAAGVFSPDQCLALGSVFAVSRSSGNSGQAQMKDLVGPGDLDLRNCGKITVVKQTDPDDSTQSFDFSVSPAAGDPSVSTFSLTDASGDPPSPSKVIDNVQPGTYTVTETVPSGWQSTDVMCTGADGEVSYGDASAEFGVVADSDVVCTFANQQLASILVEKVVAGTTDRLDGASFVLADYPEAETDTTIPAVSGETGLFCIDGLEPGSYTVEESAAPDGYEAVTDPQSVDAVVGDCDGRDLSSPDATFENKKVTSLATVPYLYPNDDAALSDGYGTPGGTITFSLRDEPAEGADACTGDVLYTQDVTVDGNGTYSTTNYPGVEGITPYAITADGLYYWEVSYTGDASNTGADSVCTAEFYDIDVEPNPAP